MSVSRYYADVSKTLKEIQEYCDRNFDQYTCNRIGIPQGYVPLGIIKDIIKSAAVDESEIGRPQGEWVLNQYKKTDGWGTINCFSHTCSVCGANRKTIKRDYCPCCGADMGNSNMEILIESMTVEGAYDSGDE